MLTLEVLVSKLRKELQDNYQSVGDSLINGGANNFEQYKYILGQAHAYRSMDQALTDMLKQTEEKDDEQKENRENIIQFGRSSED